ncbi:MAG TPA: EamA family transporter [Cytophagales bacterium]|nr:EamA family transporter [Cytophagales bacterium]HAA20976.1 EamA family transporter [Cytophagales bacterium]HAP63926.1 EamA family transporter [Cytophagales bacterium]
MAQATSQDFVKLHFIVLIWGFTAILGALITLPPVEIVFYRTGLSAIIMGLFLIYRKIPFGMGPRDTVRVLLTGVVIALHWVLFFAAARVSNVSISLIGMATATLWTSILEPLMTKRKFYWFELILGLIVIGGLYIILQVEFGYALGLLMSVLSGFLAAVFSILNGQFTKRISPYQITFWEMSGATVVVLAFFPLYARYISEVGAVQWVPSGMDYLLILILAGVCTVYAFTASVELMKRISAFAVNLTINLEPVYGIILALIIFGEAEEMGPGFYLGAVVIILAVLSYPLFKRVARKKALAEENLG